jgi:serine/threonine-protein kinase
MIGQRISHYQILEKLGEGGMGVVYKARDTHLDRFVAIKVLPPEKVADPERKRRFVQEAKAASALNHPNIITIHDIVYEEGIDFIVMEFVPGKTLGELIGRKGLKLSETLKHSIQIADALARAHAAGIVHRDLKPSNIMGDEHALVKVLDFGLAKLTEPIGPEAPTVTARTAEGTIVGTVAYMSPEQAEGKPVDARSDIFSFGAVLYEMVTGRRAFQGDTNLSTLAAIIHKEPAPLSGEMPRDLNRLIARCLRKDLGRRFQHMGDVKVALEELKEESDSGALAAAAGLVAPAARKWRGTLPWAVAAVLGLVLIGFIVTARKVVTPVATGPTRLTIDVPQTDLAPTPALSPDGRQLVYSAAHEGRRRLYLRSMDRLQAEPVPGTEGASGAIFSPDGKWLLFHAGQKLKKVSMSGGDPITLLEAPGLAGAGWAPDGSILFPGRDPAGGLVRAPAGGLQQTVTRRKPEKGEFDHIFPEVLPGGRGLLFTIIRTGLGVGKHHIGVMPPGASEHRVLVDDGYAATYSRSGHLIFRRGGALFAIPFDLDRLQGSGPATRLVEDVTESLPWSGKGYALSENGTLAYIRRDPTSNHSTPLWLDQQGNSHPVPAPHSSFYFPCMSPDGRRLALTIWEGSHADIWIWDFAREALTRITSEGNNHAAIWTPDGERLAFSSDREGPQSNLWWARADGAGKAERLTSSANHQDPGSFSPDGRLLAFGELSAGSSYDIWLLHLDEGRRTEAFLNTKFAEHTPVISPDGKWIAYTSDESGRPEICVQPFPKGGARYQISTDGGEEALWRPGGGEIYYRRGPDVLAASVSAGERFAVGKPQLLFRGNYRPRTGFGYPNWDISRDSKRFILLKPYQPDQPAPRQIIVVLNWFEELKRLAPPGKQP